MAILSAITAFLTAIPELIKIYNSIVKMVGRAKLQSFLNDLEESTRIAEDSRKPGLTLEQKRALRKQALEKGADLWSRALD